jgi:hypothetical protein
LEAKGTTIERLRKMLFGASTEKTRDVIGERGGSVDAGAEATGGAAPDVTDPDAQGDKPKPPGHGRNGAAAYPGADRVTVPHATVHAGDACTECLKGKVYPLSEPAKLLRIRGVAPLGATVFEKDRFRCNLCGEVFTAESPPGVGDEKYDATAAAMIGLLKYGTGLPFNRIEKLEKGFGIPLPAATQWDVVQGAAKLVEPAHTELINQAAQGEVLHNDDTNAKILELAGASQPIPEATDASDARARTGVFTTGVVARCQEHTVALFFTGRQHAGENLADVLSHRAAALAAPIQMCDALSRNLPGEFKTLLSNCLSHGRRYFVDVADVFPDQVEYLLEELSTVYKNDAMARQRGLSPEERLAFHQAESGPVMTRVEAWMRAQIVEKKVEPNSGLGEAIAYMQNHWTALTQFLRVAGAPLDNNVCERALKKAILHRKNSYFFKTENGAHVSDIFMSLIHTAELNGANPFDYLVALQRHHNEVAADPAAWMPWNYQEVLSGLAKGPAPPL